MANITFTMKSRRHHYLPEFYLKGFIGESGKVFVYDIQESRFKSREFSPKQIFFEWNRNSVVIDGESDDFIERLYSNWDNKLSRTFKKLCEQSGPVHYDYFDQFALMVFVSLLYWRLPEFDKEHKSLISQILNEDLLVKIYESSTGGLASKEFHDEVRKRPGFHEAYQLVQPIADYLSIDVAKRVNDWKIYYAVEKRLLHLVGDNPLICRTAVTKNVLDTELVIPLSNDQILFYTKGKRLKELRPLHRMYVDAMILLQSTKYLVGPNKQYFEDVIHFSEPFRTAEKREILRNEIFDIFYNDS